MIWNRKTMTRLLAAIKGLVKEPKSLSVSAEERRIQRSMQNFDKTLHDFVEKMRKHA